MIDIADRPVNTVPAYELCEAGLVQRREWMLYRIRSDHYPLNNSIVFELEGFDPELVQKAIDLVVAKHEILRTTLAVINGRLMQLIHHPDNFKVKYLYFDLAGKSEADQGNGIHARMSLHANASFNFEYGPIFRIVIFKLADNRYQVHVVFHHAVSDEHSYRIFRNDISEIFRMLAYNEPLYLSDSIVQYREYSRFENDLLDTAKGDEYRAFWTQELANGIPRLEVIDNSRWQKHYARYLQKVKLVKERVSRLPCYDERLLSSVIRRYELDDAGQTRYVYSRAIFDRVMAFQQAGKNSLLALFCGALMRAFHKLSGQSMFAFEIPGSSRINKKYNSTMGWLTTGGPCFMEIPADYTVEHFLDHVDHKLSLLAKYCVFPPEAVGQTVSPPVGSRMPIFLTLSYAEAELRPGQTGIVFHEYTGHGTFQDMAFFYILYKDTVTLQILYDSFLFTPALIETLITEQVNALEEIIQLR